MFDQYSCNIIGLASSSSVRPDEDAKFFFVSGLARIDVHDGITRRKCDFCRRDNVILGIGIHRGESFVSPASVWYCLTRRAVGVVEISGSCSLVQTTLKIGRPRSFYLVWHCRDLVIIEDEKCNDSTQWCDAKLNLDRQEIRTCTKKLKRNCLVQ